MQLMIRGSAYGPYVAGAIATAHERAHCCHLVQQFHLTRRVGQ